MATTSEMTQFELGDTSIPRGQTDHPSSPKASLVESLMSFEEVEIPVIDQASSPQKDPKETKTRTILVKSVNKPLPLVDTNSVPRTRKESRDSRDEIEDLKREIKVLGRENREQSLELRDLKKQNAQLRESCRVRNESADTHRDQIHHERSKFYEHVEGLEDHIAYLKQELTKRKTLVESLTLQTREANDEKATHEATAKKLQKQNRDLHENLTECKDDLLRLQPPSQIPDSELAEQYSSLTQHISRWVDDETEDSQGMETCFENLSKADEIPKSLKPYLTDEHIRLGKKSPNAQPFIIRYVVHRYLEHHIFGNDIYLFGLDARSISLFEGIQRGLHSLEPPRDTITIRRWRSETLQGLTHMPEFTSQQLTQSLSFSQSLYSTLSPLLPASNGHTTLHEAVTLPAVRLATSLRRSSVDYRLWSRPISRGETTAEKNVVNYPVYISGVQRACMVDMATNKVIRPDSVLKIAEDGRIGEEMLIVQTSLLRIQNGDDCEARDGGERGGREGDAGNRGGGKRESSITLCKPTVLVKLDEPMGKRSRGIKALGDWTGSWFGGDSNVRE